MQPLTLPCQGALGYFGSVWGRGGCCSQPGANVYEFCLVEFTDWSESITVNRIHFLKEHNELSAHWVNKTQTESKICSYFGLGMEEGITTLRGTCLVLRGHCLSLLLWRKNLPAFAGGSRVFTGLEVLLEGESWQTMAWGARSACFYVPGSWEWLLPFKCWKII